MLTAVCFLNNLWELIAFQAFMLSLVFAFSCIYCFEGLGKQGEPYIRIP